METTPTIVCLCGSTRFKAEFEHIRAQLTLRGNIVVGPDVFVRSVPAYADLHDSEAKVDLDELHLRKIDLAHVVFVVNPGNYIGDSTRREIQYALETGKPVYYHEEWYEPAYYGDETFWQATNYPMPEQCNHEDMACPQGECMDLYENREDMGR